MPQWLKGTLARIHELAGQRRVRFTEKALLGLGGLDLALDEADGSDVVGALSRKDFVERVRSKRTNEWMYIFKPRIADFVVYLKLVLRDDCVVISFHPEMYENEEEEQEDE